MNDEACQAVAESVFENVADFRGINILYFDAEGNQIAPAYGENLHVIVNLPIDEPLTVPDWEEKPFHILYQWEDGQVYEPSVFTMNEYGAEFDIDTDAVYILTAAGVVEDAETILTTEVPGENMAVSMTIPRESLPCPSAELSLEASVIEQQDAVDLVEDEIEDAEDVRRETILFDIRLLNGAGEEVQPAGPVAVAFSGIEVPNDDAQVFHVDDEAAAVEEMNAGTTEEGELVMETDHFSLYAVTYTIESFFRTFNGENFKITISFDESAEIPLGAELAVSELLPGTEEYESHYNETTELLADSISFARFFDIEIVRDGVEIEPKAPVEVKIEYVDPIEMGQGETLSIVHFADEGTEVISDVAVDDAGTEIVYQQDSFSVTGTIITGQPVGSGEGTKYAVIVKQDEKYYYVNNNGTLTETQYDPATNEVHMDSPVFWTYVTENIYGNNVTQIRVPTEAASYTDQQIARTYYYRYINPNENQATAEHPEYGEVIVDEPRIGPVPNPPAVPNPNDNDGITSIEHLQTDVRSAMRIISSAVCIQIII